MIGARRFELGLLWRLALVAAAIMLFVLAWRQPGLSAARIVTGLAAAAAAFELWHFLTRTNRAIARFVTAISFEDFTQRFALGRGGGFDALAAALDAAIIDLGKRRAQAAEEARFLAAVVEEAPVALLTITDGDRVGLLNKAARRRFGALDAARLADFAPLGSEFVAALGLPPAGRRLTRMIVDGVAQRTIVAAAQVEQLGSNVRIVSVLPVQNMLGTAEMAAQGDLVRVLTHEIMNSLTPVTSLARTAADLLAAADLPARPDLDDARAAIDTVARRAEGLHRFVESYRAFARAPEVHRQVFAAAPWASEIARLFAADPEGRAAALTVDAAPQVMIDGDPGLLAQSCLNLLRNGAAAARLAGRSPAMTMAIQTSAAAAIVIEVSDNGPGVPLDRRDDIFLPFYTTRADGHGVGLSFVRQIVVAHGGSIAVDDAPGGGARFRVVL